MSDTIIEAYKKLHEDHEPVEEMDEASLALEVLNSWDASRLGKDLAKETLFRIINHTPFPTGPLNETAKSRAEDNLRELFPELEHGHSKEMIKDLEEAYWKEKAEKERTGEKLNLK